MPARGNDSGETNYTFTITNTKGAADIRIINVLVNDFIDGRHGCYLAYIAQYHLLALVDDGRRLRFTELTSVASKRRGVVRRRGTSSGSR